MIIFGITSLSENWLLLSMFHSMEAALERLIVKKSRSNLWTASFVIRSDIPGVNEKLRVACESGKFATVLSQKTTDVSLSGFDTEEKTEVHEKIPRQTFVNSPGTLMD